MHECVKRYYVRLGLERVYTYSCACMAYLIVSKWCLGRDIWGCIGVLIELSLFFLFCLPSLKTDPHFLLHSRTIPTLM